MSCAEELCADETGSNVLRSSDKMIKPTIFQTGDIRIEYEGHSLVRIIRQDNGMAVEIGRSEWTFLIATAAIASWPTVAPETVRQIVAEVSDTDRLCRPE